MYILRKIVVIRVGTVVHDMKGMSTKNIEDVVMKRQRKGFQKGMSRCVTSREERKTLRNAYHHIGHLVAFRHSSLCLRAPNQDGCCCTHHMRHMHQGQQYLQYVHNLGGECCWLEHGSWPPVARTLLVG